MCWSQSLTNGASNELSLRPEELAKPRRATFGIELLDEIYQGLVMEHSLDTTPAQEASPSAGLGSFNFHRPDRASPHSNPIYSAIRAVDLFCGAGGLTYGLNQAGIKVVEGVDVDSACRHAYEFNNHARFVHRSVLSYSAREIKEAFGDAPVKLLAGCAPCQPFSTYTQGPRGNHRDKWALLDRFGELARDSKPDIVSMENVTPLAETERFRAFVEELKDAGFQVNHWIIDCRHYGAPQQRRRLVLLASRYGEIDILPPTHPSPEDWKVVREAISDLPPLRAGDIDPADPLHRTSRLSKVNMQRMLASKPGGTWRDWPDELRAACHTRSTGKTYPAVYGRMEWDKPAPTMTGQCFGFGNGRFGHPEQNRAISLREAAIIQTFPASYSFVEPGTPVHMKSVGRMIGNAVPPLLGYVIGKSILAHIREKSIVERA